MAKSTKKRVKKNVGGRPKKYSGTVVSRTIVMPHALSEKLRQSAKLQKCSASDLAVRALELGLTVIVDGVVVQPPPPKLPRRNRKGPRAPKKSR